MAIVAVAAWHRFSLPWQPLADRDIWGYLSPALEKLVGHDFVQSEGRAFVYPGFVYLLLSAFHSLRAVTVVQHVLGLGTGLLLLSNWRLAWRFFPRPLLSPILHDMLGLILLAVFLLSPQSMLAEHHLRPEGISPFFTMLGFGCTLRFLLAKYVESNPRRALKFGAASLAVAFFLPLLKPSYSLTSILTTLPVWWHLFDRREKWTARLAMIGVPVVSAALLLWIPEHRYSSADPRTITFLPSSLFTIHAPQIREQMASDLQSNDAAVPYSHEQLQTMLKLLDDEIETSKPTVRHGFAPLGFNPDYLLYEDSFCRKLRDILPERAARADFYRFYFRRTWQQHPGAMLQKFSAQLALFYNWDCPVYEHRSGALARNYAEMAAFLSEPNRLPLIARVPAAAEYVAALNSLAQTSDDAPHPKIFRKTILPVLARCYLPEMILAVAVCIWILADAELASTCGLFAVVVLLGYAYNLGNNVAIAFFHTLGVGRYSHVQLATTIFTQGLTLWLLMEVAVRKLAHVRVWMSGPGESTAVG